VDLYEYQARDMFERHGVPVLAGIIADTPEAAQAAAEKIGGLTVVKAQVKVGGRGKAGGVKVAPTPKEAKTAAEAILGLDIKGHVVRRVMVAQGAAIDTEFTFPYCSIAPTAITWRCVATRAEWKSNNSRKSAPMPLPVLLLIPATALTSKRHKRIARLGGFPDELIDSVAPVLVSLYAVFAAEDATLVEVNPLVLTESGQILALDGKVTLDENAGFRQPHHADLADSASADPLEEKAKAHDLNYVKLDGEVGVIGNGAGLVMSTLDVVAYAGEHHGGVRPANFLDIGGGASADVMAAGLDVILGDPQVKSVFVNVFGGITACDAVANGIVKALEMIGDGATKPLVVRLDGNSVEKGRAILAAANHPLVTLAETMDEGADKAAALAAK